MNKVILIGRLTKDPELKTTGNGTKVCSFTLAVNRPVKAEEGETADFINCIVWRIQAENLCKYQHKGSQIAVEGNIQTRNYDGDDGKKVYVTEVLANRIEFLDSAKKDTNTAPNTASKPTRRQEFEAKYKEIADDITADDLPF